MLVENLINNLTQHTFSVSEISGKIKQLLENNFSTLRIKGEISGLKIAASGHGYFMLKDHHAVIAATCWRHNLSKIQYKLEEGLEVIVTGKITAYLGQSKYQISVEHIEPEGAGAFAKILQERKKKLASEGIFDKTHKQKLPFLPKKIGIITSLSGAVIKDIVHRISDRCPTALVIWPVAVQGENSANEVSQAIDGFNQLDRQHIPDLLIVARGGGSIEDLWSFNEEKVIYSTYNSKIPIISAIGHETDYTLLDLAADIRAPTPTAAAEFAVPIITDLKYSLEILIQRNHTRITELLRFYSQMLSNHHRALKQIQDSILYHIQKIDDIAFRLMSALPNLLQQKYEKLSYFPYTRILPRKTFKYRYLQYTHLSNLVVTKSRHILNEYYYKLRLNSSLLNSLDYNNVLKRGFAMISDMNGKYLSSCLDTNSSDKIRVKMHDGEIKAKII